MSKAKGIADRSYNEFLLESPTLKPEPIQLPELLTWVRRSDALFLKKLSTNDMSWAFPGERNKHQNGPYLPEALRTGGFFPILMSIKPDKPHIRELPLLRTFWPQVETGSRTSRVVHYSNKGPETHLTGVPKAAFETLSPASFLLGGRLTAMDDGARYWFATIDSNGVVAEGLEAILDLPAAFVFAEYSPHDFSRSTVDDDEELIRELIEAQGKGAVKAFIARNPVPHANALALAAQREYMGNHRMAALDPFRMERPGDALMQISRDIEFRLYKKYERRHRVGQVLQVVLDRNGHRGIADLISAVVRSFGELNATFLSAGQQRKSRGGLSFELHIATMLDDGRIPYQAQIITGSRRPDFVMPSLGFLRSRSRQSDAALILAAKTTLRERWKQVESEKLNCPVFLATVDDRISPGAINQIAKMGIVLVVPESLKAAKETWYSKSPHVITFRDFFHVEVKERRLSRWPPWGAPQQLW
jgi:hypothetical protein